MDCPSEENMIRMKLEDENFVKLDFDISKRNLYVYHEGDIATIFNSIKVLNLGAKLIDSVESDDVLVDDDFLKERKMLWTVLTINFSFFVLEIIYGFIAKSMGLVADSLDMLADATVYGLSLFAVGHVATKKKQVAKFSGYFQLALALFGITEVVRRFLGFEEVPSFQTMIIVSLFALIGNAVSLYVLQKSQSKEIHMQASMIFTSNDVIVNIGVIAAGAFVFATNSKYPDLIVGALVFLLVTKGAFRILHLAK